MSQLRSILCLFALCLCLVPAVAGAVTFSFAADLNHDGPTFWSAGWTSIDDAGWLDPSGKIEVYLQVDTNGDAGGGLLTVPAYLTTSFLVHSYQLVPSGGEFVHQWRFNGTLYLQDTQGSLLLRIGNFQGLMTSLSPSAQHLGLTATIENSQAVDPNFIFTIGPGLEAFGIKTKDVAAEGAFAYTLTSIRLKNGAPFPKIDEQGRFEDGWQAEASWSASGIEDAK